MKKIGRNAIPALKRTVKTAKEIAPIAKDIMKLAEMYGMSLEEAEQVYKEKYGDAIVGGAIVGGMSAMEKRRKMPKKRGRKKTKMSKMGGFY